MNLLLVYLIIVFNDKVKIEIPYDSMEACRIAERLIDKEPQYPTGIVPRKCDT